MPEVSAPAKPAVSPLTQLRRDLEMNLLYDPAYFEIRFFAISQDSAWLQSIRNLLDKIATDWGQKLQCDPLLATTPDGFTFATSDRLAFISPFVQMARTVTLDARTLHDTIMLRTTVERPGELHLTGVNELDFPTHLVRPWADVPGHLGALRVWYFETEEPRASAVREFAKRCGWSWLVEAIPVETSIGTLLFGTEPPSKESTLELVFAAGPDSAGQLNEFALHPLLLTLPELALCHLKVRSSITSLRSRLLPAMNERDKELRTLLEPPAADVKLTRQEVTDRNEFTTVRHAEVVDAVVGVDVELSVMHNSRDAFVTAASDPPFDVVALRLRQDLIDRWTRNTQVQAENDMAQTEGTLRRAETHFKRIVAGAEATQARYIRKVNAKMLALTVLGVLVAAAAIVISVAQVQLAFNPPPPVQTDKP